ncbi:MAG: C1 family peptidase [Aeriscardovia sp.]|nr:C1 family peptidase [Aeriscardovia sp.]
MKELTADDIKSYADKYCSCKFNKVAQRAVTTNGIYKAAEDMNAIDRDGDSNFAFSIDNVSIGASNQNKSGRCWIYACLNTLRQHMIKTYKMADDFELSQNYLNFYDKLEKSNYFYENVIRTAKKPMDDREVWYIFATPQQDGGDWCLVCALIDKYGVVPKDAMGETSCSITSAELNTILNRKLRKDGLKLRAMVASGSSDDEISTVRAEMMEEDYRILAIALGVPPCKVEFEYRDTTDKKEFHQCGPLTPHEFYKDFIGEDLNDYVILMNVPDVDDMPFGKLYTIEDSGNMVGGRPNLYLNEPICELTKAALAQVKDGIPVWYGCDVLQQFDRDKGIMDLDLYGFNDLFGTDFNFRKGDMFSTRESLPTHAMVLAGVDLQNGEPVRWKVENSWGDKIGKKGYMVMSQAWFEEYTYEVVVNKKYLTDEQKAAFQTEPTVLPFYNGMQPTK